MFRRWEATRGFKHSRQSNVDFGWAWMIRWWDRGRRPDESISHALGPSMHSTFTATPVRSFVRSRKTTSAQTMGSDRHERTTGTLRVIERSW